MQAFSITSCMAPNMDYLVREIAAYATRRLGVPVRFVESLPWQSREGLFDEGEIEVCWICGLPYVRRADRPDPGVKLLAAPVMAGVRYAGKPIYFSDVVALAGSRYRNFADLAGAVWAYNEPASHSGYNLTRYELARRGLGSGFFGRVIEAGSHEAALAMLLRGEIDASAIDSTVLEQELMDRPELRGRLQVLETFGPSPIPPWVASSAMPPASHRALQGLLLDMHRDAEARDVLARSRMARFALVSDRDYDAVRKMAAVAEGVSLRAG